MQATTPAGTEVYNADSPPVIARGASFSEPDLKAALSGFVSRILWDDAGTAQLQAILTSAVTTGFSDGSVKRVLGSRAAPENWRVGEGLAEAFLVEHRACEFPWPSGRDLKNPAASPSGTDLVGFQKTDATANAHRFAFGEVKTSGQEAWPPSVMDGRHGLKRQLEALRDSTDVKDPLVKYLGHHANGKDWFPRYQSAVTRYLANPADFSLFGVLVRDVEPKREDLASRAQTLALGCPAETSVELRAMYLPRRSVSTLAQRALQARGGEHGKN
ncbi:MAG TPA: hypothetical protein VMH22_02575 [bacterium]|nr:hypothetical protein [bacterium]